MILKLICAAVLLTLVGCNNVERGTGQVLDNANSALKTAPGELWSTGEKGNKAKTVAEEDEEATERARY